MCLAIPGRIEAILDEDSLTRSASVTFGGIQKIVNVAFVPQASAGDYVIVHAGIAISQINAGEAQQILQELEDIGRT